MAENRADDILSESMFYFSTATTISQDRVR
jgi:hypothetical protein